MYFNLPIGLFYIQSVQTYMMVQDYYTIIIIFSYEFLSLRVYIIITLGQIFFTLLNYNYYYINIKIVYLCTHLFEIIRHYHYLFGESEKKNISKNSLSILYLVYI